MSFVPRLKAPSYSDPNWISTRRGGKNPCIMINGGPSVLPNCVGYAFGRFMEILGHTPKLCKGDAGKWYGYKSDGYKRGRYPQVGAVLCWAKPGSWGHVAIVEQINSNGTFTVSQSGYRRKRFWTSTYSIKNPTLRGYKFQGFIYNPATADIPDRLSMFLTTATSQIGKSGRWTWEHTHTREGSHWAGAFILAVAKSVKNIVNYVIPDTTSCSALLRTGVQHHMGTWHKGPNQQGSYTPKVGDIIAFRYGKSYADTYECDSLGIVQSIKNGLMSIIEGDVGNSSPHFSTVQMIQCSPTYKYISGYYSPHWNTINADEANYDMLQGTNLYDTMNTRNDAVIKEIGYVTANKPCIHMTDARLSVINYTTALGAFFKDSIASNPINTDISVTYLDLDAKAQQVVNFFIHKCGSIAVGVGIAANIKQESNFNPAAVGDHNTSFGLCGWHRGRGVAMKQFVGSGWSTNTTKQLEFLYFDMTSHYSKMWSDIISQPNTESGARRVADIFVRKYEIPAHVAEQSKIRQDNASRYWKSIVPQLKRV